ncbi:MAG: hypothetical protein D6695_10675 [Planctomycetota bacterium]|nr:MAG: hypothetical protein D6695_10675 [Planctomycetota bacterium]
MLARVRTGLVVTIITLLVWILAEGQTLRVQGASAQVRFETGSSQRIVRVDPNEGFDGMIELRVSGSMTRLEDLAEALREPLTVNVDLSAPVGTGKRVLDLRDAIRSTRPFEKSGLSLLEVTPRFVQVEVDELVEREIPVRVELPDVQLEGAPRAEPDTVTYVLPRSVSEAMDPEQAFVRAVVQPQQLANLPTGRAQRIESVRLVPSAALAESWYARTSAAQVAVLLTLRSRTSTEVLPSVPVQIRVAPAELERFHIFVPENDRFLHDVTIRGPSTLIERIRTDPSVRPVAVVSLDFEELERAVTSKEAVITFPTGFESVEAQADELTVSLIITRRNDDEPEQPPGA